MPTCARPTWCRDHTASRSDHRYRRIRSGGVTPGSLSSAAVRTTPSGSPCAGTRPPGAGPVAAGARPPAMDPPRTRSPRPDSRDVLAQLRRHRQRARLQRLTESLKPRGVAVLGVDVLGELVGGLEDQL